MTKPKTSVKSEARVALGKRVIAAAPRDPVTGRLLPKTAAAATVGDPSPIAPRKPDAAGSVSPPKPEPAAKVGDDVPFVRARGVRRWTRRN